MGDRPSGEVLLPGILGAGGNGPEVGRQFPAIENALLGDKDPMKVACARESMGEGLSGNQKGVVVPAGQFSC